MKKQLNNTLKEHVINLYKRNYKLTNIANIYEVSRPTIYNIIKKYNKTGTIERKKGSGKEKNNDTEEKILNIAKENNNLSLIQISAILFEKYDIKCSKTTVYEYLIKNDYVNKRPIIKPFLTEEHKNERQNWAIFYQHFNWDDVIWSSRFAWRPQ